MVEQATEPTAVPAFEALKHVDVGAGRLRPRVADHDRALGVSEVEDQHRLRADRKCVPVVRAMRRRDDGHADATLQFHRVPAGRRRLVVVRKPCGARGRAGERGLPTLPRHHVHATEVVDPEAMTAGVREAADPIVIVVVAAEMQEGRRARGAARVRTHERQAQRRRRPRRYPGDLRELATGTDERIDVREPVLGRRQRHGRRLVDRPTPNPQRRHPDRQPHQYLCR